MTTPFAPEIQTQAELQAVWRRLMGPWGFSDHSVWLMVVVDDRPLPHLSEITEAEHPPSAEVAGGLVELLRLLARDAGPGARFAFLRSRPGPPDLTEEDREWASALYAAAQAAAVGCEVVHLATRSAIRPIPRDELPELGRSA